MKKNVMMRVASALMVAVLLSTCAISGTFAKYVTTGSAEASARVAKWGVQIAASGDLFNEAYIHTPSAADDTSTVLAYNATDTLVAPGTRNDDGLTMTITGQPEVDVHVEIDVAAVKDVFLAAGTYSDVTDFDGTFEVPTGGYYPIVYNLTQTKDGGAATVIATGKMSDIAAVLEGLSADYNANTDLSKVIGSLKLTWAWDYTDAVGIGDDDRADTALGDLAATTPAVTKGGGAALTAGTDYCLDTEIEIIVTVTQID